MPVPAFAEVALPLPLTAAYTYRVPVALADRVVPGARVVVPLRRRELVGIVTALEDQAPEVATKDILAAPDAEPAVFPSLLKTAQWIAGYYGAPLGLTLKAVLPGPLWGESEVVLRLPDSGAMRTGGTAGALIRWLDRRGGEAPIGTAARALGKPLWEVADRLVRVGALALETRPPVTRAGLQVRRGLELVEPRLTLLERDQRFARAPARRRLYEALEHATEPVPAAELAARVGVGAEIGRQLVKQGLARVVELERARDPFAALTPTAPPASRTDAQRAALAAIERLEPGDGCLLFGVTGSGKTVVYLDAIRRALDSGLGSIVLVPEIGLTPQTVSRVRGMFGDEVAVLHSGLSDGERADAWRALRRGERRVTVGARSAVFAPIERLGLIVVDEEHEPSYKNGESPRYHARDVAAVRCRLDRARLVLGSATPALETAVAAPGRLAMVRLPQRVEQRPLPPVELVDLRTAPRVEGIGAVPWSEALDTALRAAVDRGEQALLLLNRRGYAAYLFCPGCGAVRQCPRCDISLTVHRAPSLLRCHYCGHHEPLDRTCPACGHPVARARGVGTQQVEQVVAERLPRARVARMDLDTTSAKWSHHRIFDRVERGEIDVLVGTQMVAKGIDFPNVTLVGVVDADTALHLPDFRAAERTFQLLTQVAGRAGRGPKGGRVLVQTRSPEHHALRLAQRHDTEGFWAAELAARERPPYPPATSLVNVLVSGLAEPQVSRECARFAEWLAGLVTRHRLPCQVLGPAPCPIARLKDRWRWHVVLKGPPEALGRVVRYAAPRLRGSARARIAIDRDPVSLL
jgi:primosomal protein N' (replication factor Y)